MATAGFVPAPLLPAFVPLLLHSCNGQSLAQINALVDPEIQEKDHASFEMLPWFIKEQGGEEKNPSDIPAEIHMHWRYSRPSFLS